MSLLRYLADSYEQSQRLRIQTGERIRAVLQGRDATFGPSLDGYAHRHPKKKADEEVKCKVCIRILGEVGQGKHTGPVDILGRTYHRHFVGEKESFKAMAAALDGHPAWPWLNKVKGVGDTLACKILARLDIRKADTISAFWAYCGLATVPGTKYVCATCRLEKTFPVDYEVTGKHLKLNSQAKCKGMLTADGEGRCAQPKPRRGEKAAYDQYAKKICYLIAMQFVKLPGSPYERFYRRERDKLTREKTGWPKGRIHATALRKTEKLFLSHLWQIWREGEGLPVTKPWVHEHGGHENFIRPEEMVGSRGDEETRPKKASRKIGKTQAKGASRVVRGARVGRAS